MPSPIAYLPSNGGASINPKESLVAEFQASTQANGGDIFGREGLKSHHRTHEGGRAEPALGLHEVHSAR